MKVLKFYQRIFSIIGLCPLADGSEFILKFSQMSCTLLITVISLLTVWGSGFSLLEFVQIGDFQKNAFVLIEVMAPIPTLLSFISLVYRRKSVREFCIRMQQIYDQCNSKIDFFIICSFHICDFLDRATPVAILYSRADKTGELFMKWTTMFV